MVKKYTKRRRQRKNKRRTMKGGVLSEENLSMSQGSLHLSDLNTSNNSNEVNDLNMSDISNISSIDNSANTTVDDQSLLNFGDIEPIPHEGNDIYDLDMDETFDLNGPLNESDLNVSQDTNMSGNTTNPDDSSFINFGGKRRKKLSKKKQNKKGRKTRKNKRKQKGGTCFGNGVGANSYDPNFSIYNTRELELFPYRPK